MLSGGARSRPASKASRSVSFSVFFPPLLLCFPFCFLFLLFLLSPLQLLSSLSFVSLVFKSRAPKCPAPGLAKTMSGTWFPERYRPRPERYRPDRHRCTRKRKRRSGRCCDGPQPSQSRPCSTPPPRPHVPGVCVWIACHSLYGVMLCAVRM